MSGSNDTITWLHISDLHFRKSQNFNETIVLKALVEDVGRDMAQRIDQVEGCVVVTFSRLGDLYLPVWVYRQVPCRDHRNTGVAGL